MSTGAPQLGITLYSLTREYRAGRYTFEELVRKAGEQEVGPPVELVGFQSIRGYPAISDDFALRFPQASRPGGSDPLMLGRQRRHRTST